MMTGQILFSLDKQCYRAKRIKQQLYGKYYKMFASKNDWQDESLTSQVHDQAAHCPLTGHYFEPCSHVFNYPGLLMLANGVILHNNWIWFVIIDLLKSYAISHNPDQVSLLKKWCIINKVVLQNNFHFQQNLHKRNAARTVFRIWVLIFQRGCALRKILGIQMLWTWNPGCPAYYLHAKTDSDFLVTHSKSQTPGHSGCC